MPWRYAWNRIERGLSSISDFVAPIFDFPYLSSLRQLLIGNTDGEILTDELDFYTPEPDIVEVPCARYDGVLRYSDTHRLPLSTDVYELHGRLLSLTTNRLNGSNDAANHRFYMGASNGKWAVGYGNAYDLNGDTADTLPHWFKFEGGKMYLDGGVTAVADASHGTFAGEPTTSFFLGAYSTASSTPFNFCSIELYEVRINGETVYTCEEQGDNLLDASGAGNHATTTQPPTWIITDHKGKCASLENGFTDAGSYTAYDILLIAEDAKNISGTTITLQANHDGYHLNADEPQVSANSPDWHRTQLDGRGYSFNNEGDPIS